MAKYNGEPETTAESRPAAAGGRARSVGRGAGARGLSRARIVDSALALVDEHGLPSLTFRRLGAALGCEAMSVYHYFPSKRHLLDALVEKTLEGVGEPPPELDPIARLRFLGHEYRAMAHRYPKLFPLAALHRLNMPAGVAFIERMLGHFRAAIPDDRTAAQVFRIFGYYVVGAALDETSGYAAGPSAAAVDRRTKRSWPNRRDRSTGRSGSPSRARWSPRSTRARRPRVGTSRHSSPQPSRRP